MNENTDIDVKRIHDLLLVSKPSEASHKASLCPLCEGSSDGNDTHEIDDTSGGDVSTFTQGDLDEAVAKATAEIQAKLDSYLQEQGLAEVEVRLSEMTVAHEAEVAELKAQIDTAVASAEAVKTERDELVAYLDEVGTQAEAKQALEARREEIKSAVADLFSADHIEANIERWASLEEEAFEAVLSDWNAAAKVAAKAAKSTDGSKKDVTKDDSPASTAMEQSADNDGDRSVTDIRRALHTRGNEVRTVGASYTAGGNT